MRSPKWIGPAVLLLGLLVWALPALADEVYISNKPFKGPVAGTGADTWVGLQALAKALGAEVKESGGSWYVGEAPASAGEVPAGSVVVAGKVVPSRPGPEGAPMVRLKEAAEGMGAVVRVNKALGSIDVNRPVAKMNPASAAGGDSAAAAPSGPMAPIHLNSKNPGAAVNIDSNLVAGRTNIVYFYADW